MCTRVLNFLFCFFSRYGDLGGSEVVQADPSGLNPLEIRAADMSFSALYLHEVSFFHLKMD